VEHKPKIRKTKEELILENEVQLQRMKAGKPNTAAGHRDSRGFAKPNLKLDPAKLKTNSKFDDIPDSDGVQSKPKLAAKASKPQSSLQQRMKEQKAEKPLTDKLTNIAINTTTNTAYNVERRIDRLHTQKKEITQKPNFAQYQPQRGEFGGFHDNQH
jgi:hypothetical protein